MRSAWRLGLVAATTVALLPVTGVVAPAAQAAGKPTIRVYDAAITEGTGGQTIVAFAVQLSKPARKTVHFKWRTTKGSAKAGADYTRVPGRAAKILKGRSSTTLVVRVAADAIDEYAETFGVQIYDVPGSLRVADARAKATIRDDDPAPRLTVPRPEVVEGIARTKATVRYLEVKLRAPSGKPAAVSYRVLGGTAEIGVDLEAEQTLTRLRFAPGKTTARIKLRIHGDDQDEPNKTFRVIWRKPLNLKLPANRRTVVTLLDDDGPLQPQIRGTTPASPSPNATPLVFGLAPGGSTVEVYLNGSCAGAPVATGSANAFNGSGLSVPVAANQSNILTVKATNTVGGEDSACSLPFTYVHDSIAPPAPDGLAGDPPSPTQSHTVVVTGHAEAGSSVAVYLDASCSGTPYATVSAAAFQSPGVTITGLAEGAHTVRAAATDAAGNVSGCSDPLVLVVDNTAQPPTLDPIPDGTDPYSPVLTGTAEAGSTVTVYDSAGCSGNVVGTVGASALQAPGVALGTFAAGSYAFSASLVDQAGNSSGCSATVAFTVQ